MILYSFLVYSKVIQIYMCVCVCVYIYICMCVYTYIYLFLSIMVYYKILNLIPCYSVGLCWLPILYIVICIC